MDLIKTGKYTTSLIRSILLDETPPQFPDGVKPEDVFKLSKLHMISNMTWSGVKKLGISIDAELMKEWQHSADITAVQSVVQLAERNKLYKIFEQNEISYVPLKGCVVKELYPKPEYREMSDLDILLHKADADRARMVLEDSGYSTARYDIDKDDSYFKKPFLHVEIHFELLSHHERLRYEQNNTSYRLINDPWSLAVRKSDFRYEFRHEDTYMHLVIHLYKDFSHAGTGIRQITDLYIFRHAYALDWDYINKELQNIGLFEFHERIVSLLNVWYGDTDPSEDTNQLEAYIFDAGSYGKLANAVEHKIQSLEENGQYEKKSLFAYLLFRLFPPYEEMCIWYPAVRKSKFLLPGMWIYRLCYKGKTRSMKAFLELKTIGKKLFSARKDQSD